ncbi:hypothetical protein DUNSADRAFT_11330 [Dunaliella salina]|uniref:Uncharacterized protein n=1 Tax=Dunaliella salina TaxID=3046 RepID=A0ABQ7H4K5_DUNSA|nr:hypothetical protein DUNSADRAFT_11330 [Dunaliella salina]KAF5841772.1 hypothetical protein DUNSADRAFT_11330 [Dunaliella salina]|eukprot:KAF5841771.1 hypothetical protein DUNSADRAFT_11330 [Dunaliella salina]
MATSIQALLQHNHLSAAPTLAASAASRPLVGAASQPQHTPAECPLPAVPYITPCSWPSLHLPVSPPLPLPRHSVLSCNFPVDPHPSSLPELSAANASAPFVLMDQRNGGQHEKRQGFSSWLTRQQKQQHPTFLHNSLSAQEHSLQQQSLVWSSNSSTTKWALQRKELEVMKHSTWALEQTKPADACSDKELCTQAGSEEVVPFAGELLQQALDAGEHFADLVVPFHSVQSPSPVASAHAQSGANEVALPVSGDQPGMPLDSTWTPFGSIVSSPMLKPRSSRRAVPKLPPVIQDEEESAESLPNSPGMTS